MRKFFIAGTALALGVLFGGTVERAAAMTVRPGELAALAHHRAGAPGIRVNCRCNRDFPPQQYWRWDHRPVWDDPWQVLRPNFWGSPEPYLVPADRWARKWHLPRHRAWYRGHHRHDR